ncbi:hypothetical protein N7489_003035 [Penicillium chrysogenum]|jgi:hypothetical protein|uniref:uncharacterized protein n=1 Tax=Penicillium chrysogenum TaxID=5076 RepID=UPI0024DF0B88|nr:uncharacterized protein N7489_003035 [Penicillium chrysogenum]KAJ5252625.1 hypothetical protein N7489_003035 [Penicillium chrysogenum]
MGLFKRSFFNNRWGGLGGVETGKIENEPAAARTRKGSVRSSKKGGVPQLLILWERSEGISFV